MRPPIAVLIVAGVHPAGGHQLLDRLYNKNMIDILSNSVPPVLGGKEDLKGDNSPSRSRVFEQQGGRHGVEPELGPGHPPARWSISGADPLPKLRRAACIPQLRMACEPVREFSVERLDVPQGQFSAAGVFVVLLGQLGYLRSGSAVHRTAIT